MPTVRIPSPLRGLTGGAPTVEAPAGELRDVIHALDAAHPGLAARILDGDGELRPFVHVFVGDTDVRSAAGLATRVGGRDVVAIVPAVAGGGSSDRP
ncbi:MAG: MoaD/ThiS family protein [Nitriliruptor sp.]